MNIVELRASQIQAIGIKVTTICKLGGVGLGYVLPDDCYKDREALKNIAWQSGGNGFYYAREFKEVRRDGGAGYREAVNSLGLPKAYKL